jgi:uncharacterized protein YcnI
MRRLTGLAAAVVGGVGLVLFGAVPARAHVLLESATPNGDGTATLTFAFDHGCDGAPTAALDMTVPDGVEPLRATGSDGWTGTVEGDRVRWSGPPVPDGVPAGVNVIVRVNGSAGQSFAFPTVQECVGGGSYEWTGTDPSSPEPAPSFVATAAVLAPSPATTGAGTGASLPVAVGAAGGMAVVAAVGGSMAVRRRAVSHPSR